MVLNSKFNTNTILFSFIILQVKLKKKILSKIISEKTKTD